jgi:hypothetical protein
LGGSKVVYQYIRDNGNEFTGEPGEASEPFSVMNKDLLTSDDILRQGLLNIKSSELNIKEESGMTHPDRDDKQVTSLVGGMVVGYPVYEEQSHDEQSIDKKGNDEKYNIVFLGE